MHLGGLFLSLLLLLVYFDNFFYLIPSKQDFSSPLNNMFCNFQTQLFHHFYYWVRLFLKTGGTILWDAGWSHAVTVGYTLGGCKRVF